MAVEGTVDHKGTEQKANHPGISTMKGAQYLSNVFYLASLGQGDQLHETCDKPD